MDEIYIFTGDDIEGLTPEEAFAARRRRYLCAKVSAANLSLWAFAARIGLPEAAGREDEFRKEIRLAQEVASDLKAEFGDDPVLAAEIWVNTYHTCKKLLAAIEEKMATQRYGTLTVI